jgi:hypothetical protein
MKEDHRIMYLWLSPATVPLTREDDTKYILILNRNVDILCQCLYPVPSITQDTLYIRL